MTERTSADNGREFDDGGEEVNGITRLENNDVVDSVTKGFTQRRSQRLSVKSSMATGSLAMLNHESEFESGTTSVFKGRKNMKIRSKKTSEKKSVRKNKVGQLEALKNMPLDIFCEIAGNLSPQDLLNMSRSSKSLHTLLTSKNSKPIWRAARDGMGIPECPGDLSEMQYADLLFGIGCSLCDARRAKTLYFSVRLRLCRHCRDEKLAPSYMLQRTLHADESFLSLLPYVRLGGDAKFYNEAEAEAVWNHLQSLPVDSTERIRYVAEREERFRGLEDNAERVQRWIARQSQMKYSERREIIQERRRSIMEKLKNKGYTDEDLDCTVDNDDMWTRWSKLTQNPKPLTDRIWKNLEPKAEEIIMERREKRAELAEMDDDEFDCSDCEAEASLLQNTSSALLTLTLLYAFTSL